MGILILEILKYTAIELLVTSYMRARNMRKVTFVSQTMKTNYLATGHG